MTRWSYHLPIAEDDTFGLAIVQVPEPPSVSLLWLWLCGVVCRRRFAT